jgi:hypothetical protein
MKKNLLTMKDDLTINVVSINTRSELLLMVTMKGKISCLVKKTTF